MLRFPAGDHWHIVLHRDFAALVSKLVRHWENAHFPRPDPFTPIQSAARRLSDLWLEKDAYPSVNEQGAPGVESSMDDAPSLLGELGLDPLLTLYGRSTDLLAKEDALAAALAAQFGIRQLDNLDLRTRLDSTQRIRLQAFVDRQSMRQAELIRMGAVANGFSQPRLDEWLETGCRVLLDCHRLARALHSPAPAPARNPFQLRPQPEPHTWQLHPFPFNTHPFTIPLRWTPIPRQPLHTTEELRQLLKNTPTREFSTTLIP